jgi:hypothetical protein
MFKIIAKLLGAIALTGWMGIANATLIFDFSWEESGLETRGEIRLLGNSILEQAATRVTLTKLNDVEVDLEFIGGAATVVYNAFIVNNNKISSVSFEAFIGSSDQFDDSFIASLFINPLEAEAIIRLSQSTYNYGFGNYELLKREVTVPEPGTVILLSLGLAGLSFAQYRRQS